MGRVQFQVECVVTVCLWGVYPSFKALNCCFEAHVFTLHAISTKLTSGISLCISLATAS